MAGEEFAWKMLKKGLDLSDEDVAALREGVLELKDLAPEMKERAEKTEMRVMAICHYLRGKDEKGWSQAEMKAIEHFRASRKPK